MTSESSTYYGVKYNKGKEW